jgi:hypothetical protein
MRAEVTAVGTVLWVLGAAWPGAAADVYVRVSVPRAAVREAADAKAPLVGYARRDDVFKLSQEQEGWYGVVLFSGDVRYIPAAQLKKSSYSPSAPPELFLRRELFRAFAKADTRAKAEAERKNPADFGKHQRLLEDRYKLDVVQRYRLPAPVYGPIQKEGAESGWR